MTAELRHKFLSLCLACSCLQMFTSLWSLFLSLCHFDIASLTLHFSFCKIWCVFLYVCVVYTVNEIQINSRKCWNVWPSSKRDKKEPPLTYHLSPYLTRRHPCTHKDRHTKTDRQTDRPGVSRGMCSPGFLCLSTKRNKLAGGLLGSEFDAWPEHAALKKEPHSAVGGHKPNNSTVSAYCLWSFWTNRKRQNDLLHKWECIQWV